MKYVCVDYRPENNSVEIMVMGDTIISNKFTIHDQTFVTYKGTNHAVMYSSDYDSEIRDFVTLIRLGYQGLKVNIV